MTGMCGSSGGGPGGGGPEGGGLSPFPLTHGYGGVVTYTTIGPEEVEEPPGFVVAVSVSEKTRTLIEAVAVISALITCMPVILNP